MYKKNHIGIYSTSCAGKEHLNIKACPGIDMPKLAYRFIRSYFLYKRINQLRYTRLIKHNETSTKNLDYLKKMAAFYK